MEGYFRFTYKKKFERERVIKLLKKIIQNQPKSKSKQIKQCTTKKDIHKMLAETSSQKLT